MILSEFKNRIFIIWLNRPEKRNALSFDLVSELKDKLKEAIANKEVKMITIRGKGEAFCAGADLESLQKLQSASYEDNFADSEHLAELFRMIYFSPKPVLAAVHGHAIAGGSGLVTVCDFSIVKRGAKLGYTETRIGFVPAIVSKFIVDKCGSGFAKDVLMSGRLFSADEAYSKSLITEVTDENEFEERVQYWQEMILTKTSSQAVQITKKLIHEAAETSVEKFITKAVEANATARSSDDCKRGINAFLNKEHITW